MHAIFLYHCIQNGMDFGIVNAGAMPIYEDIPQPMRQYCEEVVLNESADGGHVERLLKFAEEEKERKDAGGGKVVKKDAAEWRNKPIKERLAPAPASPHRHLSSLPSLPAALPRRGPHRRTPRVRRSGSPTRSSRGSPSSRTRTWRRRASSSPRRSR